MGALQAMVVCLFLVRACTTNAQVEQWKSATATYSKETDALNHNWCLWLWGPSQDQLWKVQCWTQYHVVQ
ncbi:hypothetical protein CK203_069560 [Vitis vinifera]|uniref:Uncharacterized protein n=1 Tax=Vitis vinifera TaxID=29760 RepID=A0A438EKK0_VITVI|nr:hypothetical protein CK203_069560 [Vitis vinifera]